MNVIVTASAGLFVLKLFRVQYVLEQVTRIRDSFSYSKNEEIIMFKKFGFGS